MASPPSSSGGDAPGGRDLERLATDAEIDRIADAVAERLAARPQPPMEVRVTDYMSYVAPLPPPEWYRGYDQVVPGAGHRILTLVEEEAKHRRWFDRQFAQYRLLGLICAFVVTMSVIGSGVFLIHENKKTYGFAVIIANVVALAGLFVIREIRRNGNGD